MALITARDAINRGYNLLGVGVVVLSGLAFASDLPAELDHLPYIVDEVLLAVLAIIAVVWYLIGRNKYSYSIVPIIFAGTALVIKVLGLYLEFADPEDRGDEFGALILFSILTIVLIWQYIATKRLASQTREEAQLREKVQSSLRR